MLGRTPMDDDGARNDVERWWHGMLRDIMDVLKHIKQPWGGKHLINKMIRDVELHNKGIKKDIEHVKKM